MDLSLTKTKVGSNLSRLWKPKSKPQRRRGKRWRKNSGALSSTLKWSKSVVCTEPWLKSTNAMTAERLAGRARTWSSMLAQYNAKSMKMQLKLLRVLIQIHNQLMLKALFNLLQSNSWSHRGPSLRTTYQIKWRRNRKRALPNQLQTMIVMSKAKAKTTAIDSSLDDPDQEIFTRNETVKVEWRSTEAIKSHSCKSWVQEQVMI